jgi:type VI secretion system secreted protein VgrG
VLNKSTCLHFFSNAAHLTPGMVLEADGSMLNDLEAGITSQTAMFDQRLKPLNEMIHFHGPQDVAFTSGEHMQLAASKNMAMNAGGDFSCGSLGNTAVLAGEQIGLFARSGSLTLNASEGRCRYRNRARR